MHHHKFILICYGTSVLYIHNWRNPYMYMRTSLQIVILLHLGFTQLCFLESYSVEADARKDARVQKTAQRTLLLLGEIIVL